MQSDEKLYELAAQELANSPRQGLLIKCLAKAEGNEAKGKAFYIEARVEEMKTEIIAEEKKEAVKKAAEKKAEKEKEFQDGVVPYPYYFVVLIFLIVCIVVIIGNF